MQGTVHFAEAGHITVEAMVEVGKTSWSWLCLHSRSLFLHSKGELLHLTV